MQPITPTVTFMNPAISVPVQASFEKLISTTEDREKAYFNMPKKLQKRQIQEICTIFLQHYYDFKNEISGPSWDQFSKALLRLVQKRIEHLAKPNQLMSSTQVEEIKHIQTIQVISNRILNHAPEKFKPITLIGPGNNDGEQEEIVVIRCFIEELNSKPLSKLLDPCFREGTESRIQFNFQSNSAFRAIALYINKDPSFKNFILIEDAADLIEFAETYELKEFFKELIAYYCEEINKPHSPYNKELINNFYEMVVYPALSTGRYTALTSLMNRGRFLSLINSIFEKRDLNLGKTFNLTKLFLNKLIIQSIFQNNIVYNSVKNRLTKFTQEVLIEYGLEQIDFEVFHTLNTAINPPFEFKIYSFSQDLFDKLIEFLHGTEVLPTIAIIAVQVIPSSETDIQDIIDALVNISFQHKELYKIKLFLAEDYEGNIQIHLNHLIGKSIIKYIVSHELSTYSASLKDLFTHIKNCIQLSSRIKAIEPGPEIQIDSPTSEFHQNRVSPLLSAFFNHISLSTQC